MNKMRIFSFFALVPTVLLTSLLFSACSSPSSVAPKDIQTNVLAAVEQGATIIDVRTPEEYAEGHLENAVNIDFKAASFSEEVGKLDKSNPYLVYCKSGVRSAKSVTLMKELGFKDVADLNGGITKWIADGKNVVR